MSIVVVDMPRYIRIVTGDINAISSRYVLIDSIMWTTVLGTRLANPKYYSPFYWAYEGFYQRWIVYSASLGLILTAVQWLAAISLFVVACP